MSQYTRTQININISHPCTRTRDSNRFTTKKLKQTTTLNRNSDRLLEPDHRRGIMMYGSELPTCLIEQVTKISDRAFLAIMIAHHLLVGAQKESQLRSSSFSLFLTIRS
jgi:hypothetical protein